jgi:wobble nucleotide-excising tRNase
LDKNRRQHTRDTLKDIGNRCSQLIVLGHDLYFLRDLHDDLTPDDGRGLPKLIKLSRVHNGYTNFMELKIDHECENAYYKHYRLLTEFVDGSTNSTDLHAIAKAIRPMLEGYLHRRFPCRIKRSWMFRTILSEVGKARLPDSLKYIEPLIQELNDINRFAGKFHHDTNAAVDTLTVSDSELKTFAEPALRVVHKGTP